jgi:hypothetical protein
MDKIETIDQAAKEYDAKAEYTKYVVEDAFIAGAKWQAERMYSEEEVIELLNKHEDYVNSEDNIFEYLTTKEWFKQFKNK